jgi:hypothetical protein
VANHDTGIHVYPLIRKRLGQSQIHTGFHVPGDTRETNWSPTRFAYGSVTLCGAPFQSASATRRVCNSMEGLVPLRFDPTTPFRQRHQALPPERFRLDPFSLAATGGVAVAFLSSRY